MPQLRQTWTVPPRTPRMSTVQVQQGTIVMPPKAPVSKGVAIAAAAVVAWLVLK